MTNADAQLLPSMTALADWMCAIDGQSLPCLNAVRLHAGTQNLMVLFDRGDSRFVLRQPPEHAIVPPLKIVSRETRVLRALSESAVPHPQVFGLCTDDTLGSAFYVMSAADGFNPTEGLPPSILANAQLQRRIGLSCIEALFSLSRVDYQSVGLGDLGKPDGFLERQVARWQGQLASYAQFEGWGLEGAFLRVDEVGGWLSAHLPPARQPGLLHGDFHLGNVIFRSIDASVSAIIDWELATIGDPLIDLGWLIATWPELDGQDSGSGISVPSATALASIEDLITHYKTLSGDPLDHLTWYVVLACYKLGIIQEGSWARALGGKADRSIGQLQHDRALALLRKAEGLIRDGVSNANNKENDHD